MNDYVLLIAFIIILINKISFSLCKKSKILPVYKIALSQNLSQINKNSNYNLIVNDLKGIGLIFDSDSEINLIPQQLMKYIELYYNHFEETITNFIPKEDGYIEFILQFYYGGTESLHFIFENTGISLPINDLLKYEESLHKFKFMTKDNQENIIIGKVLIEVLGIDLNDLNNFIVNEKYISKIEDDE